MNDAQRPGESRSDYIDRINQPFMTELDKVIKSGTHRSLTGYEDTQLELLDLFSLRGKQKWTRAIAFYDALPKYLFSSGKRFETAKASDFLSTECDLGGQKWQVQLKPAQITDAAKPFFAYPGEREELVARALRYLAVQGGVPLSFWESATKPAEIRVAFTLHQIVTQLAGWGHTFNSKEIDEALSILSGTRLNISMTDDKKKVAYDGGIVAGYFSENKGSEQEQMRRIVILNPLETENIIKGHFRALNYERMMSLQSALARRIYEYVLTHHLAAEKPSENPQDKPPKPFVLPLRTVLQECCIQPQKQLRDTIARIRAALDELKEFGVLWRTKPYEEKLALQAGRGRPKIADATWSLYLSASDTADVIAANSETKYHKPDAALQPRRNEFRKLLKEKL